MKLGTIAQFSKNAQRLREVVSVLAKYGLAHWVNENDPEFVKGLLKSSGGEQISKLPTEVRIRMAITELGTTFIKLGQILSTRSDIIGPSIADELTKLQADVPADDGAVVRQVVEQEFGRHLEELFAEFDLQQLGSASVGQVHRATLKSGETLLSRFNMMGLKGRYTMISKF